MMDFFLIFCREIFSTEKTYVSQLDDIVNAVMKPLLNLTGTPKQVLEAKDIRMIFSNVEMILGVNKRLLQTLEERVSGWSPAAKLGDIFLKVAPFLKLYIEVNFFLKFMFQVCEQLQHGFKNPK